MEVDHLNGYQYKKYLLFGEDYLKELDQKEKKDEEDIAQIKITSVRLKRPKDYAKVKSQNYRDNTARTKTIVKHSKQGGQKQKREKDFERNKYHLLNYADIIQKQIKGTTSIDNYKVIDFLKGDEGVIWELITPEYISWYAYFLKTKGIEARSTEMSIEDLIMEAFINKIIPLIKKGKFTGHCNFSTWALKVVKFYIMSYYTKNGYTVEYNSKNLYTYKNNKKFIKKY